jgi:hypothetical protein
MIDANNWPPSADSSFADRVKFECGFHGKEVQRLLRFFEFDHLPPHLQAVSKPCGELALAMAERFSERHSIRDDESELLDGLKRLLEAKDWFVRALVAKR